MPAVPTPPTLAPGILTSSQLNQLRDVQRFMQSPPRFDLRQSSAQSLPNNADTAVMLDTEDIDTDIDGTGGHSGGSPTLWTCRYPGVYLLHGKVTFTANAVGIRVAYLQVNGSDVPGTANIAAATSVFDQPLLTNPRKVVLGAGDQVRIMAFQNSGSSLNTFATAGFGRYWSTLSGLWVSVA